MQVKRLDTPPVDIRVPAQDAAALHCLATLCAGAAIGRPLSSLCRFCRLSSTPPTNEWQLPAAACATVVSPTQVDLLEFWKARHGHFLPICVNSTSAVGHNTPFRPQPMTRRYGTHNNSTQQPRANLHPSLLSQPRGSTTLIQSWTSTAVTSWRLRRPRSSAGGQTMTPRGVRARRTATRRDAATP